jgi:hypothetical protein
LPGAVQWVVDAQLDCGVDVINDGEYVKAAGGGSYSGYIHQRVTGWEVRPIDQNKPRKRDGVGGRERRMFPGFYESGLWLQGPHVTDIELVHIADLLLKVNAQAYSVEAGNVRHAHEWTM